MCQNIKLLIIRLLISDYWLEVSENEQLGVRRRTIYIIKKINNFIKIIIYKQF